MYEENFIGKRISFYRKQLHLTLHDLANLVGTSPGYLSDIEKGKTLLSIPKLIEICNALGITLKDFFDDGTKTLVFPEHFQDFFEKNKDLTPEQLKQLTEFLKTLK